MQKTGRIFVTAVAAMLVTQSGCNRARYNTNPFADYSLPAPQNGYPPNVAPGPSPSPYNTPFGAPGTTPPAQSSYPSGAALAPSYPQAGYAPQMARGFGYPGAPMGGNGPVLAAYPAPATGPTSGPGVVPAGASSAAAPTSTGPTMANAADYSWLKGELEHVNMGGGFWKLRYRPISDEDDRYGGSVVLGSDPRLNQFKEGDVIYVEGRVTAEKATPYTAAPVYEMRNAQLVAKAAPSGSTTGD